jgi:hypothetical protein
MSPAARGCCNAARVHDLVGGCYIETKLVLIFIKGDKSMLKKAKFFKLVLVNTYTTNLINSSISNLRNYRCVKLAVITQ